MAREPSLYKFALSTLDYSSVSKSLRAQVPSFSEPGLTYAPRTAERGNNRLGPRSYTMKQRSGLGKKVSSIFDGVALPGTRGQAQQSPPSYRPADMAPAPRQLLTVTPPPRSAGVAPPRAPRTIPVSDAAVKSRIPYAIFTGFRQFGRKNRGLRQCMAAVDL